MHLYSDFFVPYKYIQEGLEGLKRYFKILSKKYGYEVTIPEGTINNAGYSAIYSKKYDKAILIFKFYVKKYPKSNNAYDGLGDAYKTMGNTELAIENYKKA